MSTRQPSIVIDQPKADTGERRNVINFSSLRRSSLQLSITALYLEHEMQTVKHVIHHIQFSAEFTICAVMSIVGCVSMCVYIRGEGVWGTV